MENNIFVFTRNVSHDYAWFLKPDNITDITLNVLLKKMEQIYRTENNQSPVTRSGWFRYKIDDSVYALFRLIVDGRMDNFGRKIRRYEGGLFPNSIDPKSVIPDLNNTLLSLEAESNNYRSNPSNKSQKTL